MQPDCTTVSLGLPESRVWWVHESDFLVLIEVVRRNKFALCPACGRVTQHVHDERVDDVWDVPILGKGVKLLLVKRRWWCDTPGCEQITPFTEGFDGFDAGQHRTYRLNAYMYRLTKRIPNTEVVRELAHHHILILSGHQLVRPREHSGHTPPELERIILRALKPNPTQLDATRPAVKCWPISRLCYEGSRRQPSPRH